MKENLLVYPFPLHFRGVILHFKKSTHHYLGNLTPPWDIRLKITCCVNNTVFTWLDLLKSHVNLLDQNDKSSCFSLVALLYKREKRLEGEGLE